MGRVPTRVQSRRTVIDRTRPEELGGLSRNVQTPLGDQTSRVRVERVLENFDD